MSEEQQKKGLVEGPPIWVESLLSAIELKAMSLIYNTYNPGRKMIASFERNNRWRYRMGDSYTESEIKIINKVNREILELIKEQSSTPIVVDATKPYINSK